jgi:hypothetical protein
VALSAVLVVSDSGVEAGHELTVGGAGGGEFVGAFVELQS